MTQRRNLVYENCDPGDRHCQPVPERDQNIFDRNSNGTTVENGSENTCTSDATGSYSKLDNANATDGKQTEDATPESDLVVEFQYQVQTTLSETSTDLQSNSSALLVIEKAISDVLVASLFEDCHASMDSNAAMTTTQRTGTRQRHHRRDLIRLRVTLEGDVLTGVSADPPDRLLPGRAAVDCRTQLAPEADRCYIVAGAYSLRGTGDISWVQQLSTIVIKEAMEKGQLNSIHPDIFDVHFVSEEPYNPKNDKSWDRNAPPISQNGARDREALDQDSVPTWPWILLSMGTLLICCLLACIVRLTRRRGRETSVLDSNEIRRRELLLKQQDRVLQNRTVTFESEGQSAGLRSSASFASTPGSARIAMTPLDPDLYDPTKPSEEQQFYMSPMQQDEEVYNAFDRLLEAVALQDSASSSDGEDDGHSSEGRGEGSFPLDQPGSR